LSDWRLGPVTAHGRAVIATRPSARFTCAVSKQAVRWAAKDVFNPGGVVRDGKIHLLLRAEDSEGRFGGTSRIGLFDLLDPSSCIIRGTEPFLRADQVGAAYGQVGNVCFAQALLFFEDAWRLYFGMAYSRIGCAVAAWSGD
jgi:predicted GH43/DUF377 family glycosyl hydrolase